MLVQDLEMAIPYDYNILRVFFLDSLLIFQEMKVSTNKGIRIYQKLLMYIVYWMLEQDIY